MKKINWLKKFFSVLCATALVLTASLGIAPSVVSAEETTTGTGSNRYDPWDGPNGLDVTAVEYAGGDGTEANPYLIKNGNQLYKAATNGGANNYFRLENDIYLNDVSAEKWYEASGLNEWITGGNTFSGHFDGNGYVVHGIYYKDTATEMAALFPRLGPYDSVTSVTVKNVGIEDSYIQGTHAGAITAVVDGTIDGNHTVNISCCYADESVYLKGSNSNGFVAFLFNYYFTMDNCASRVRMKGTHNSDEPRGSLLGAMWLPDESGLASADKAKKITIKDSYAVLQKEDRETGFSAIPWSYAGVRITYNNVHGGVYPDDSFPTAIYPGDLYNSSNCAFGHWPSDFRTAELRYFSREIWLAGDGADRYMIPKVFVTFEYGDTNRDLTVDICDLVYLKKVTSNDEGVSNNNSDLNGDGEYNDDDLVLLRTKLLNG